MSFSTDLAGIVSSQLSRFVTLNRHQLAGQVANLDFWLAQVQHALSIIDGYDVRFIRMHAAQEQYVAVHGTMEFGLNADLTTERKPSPARRVPDRELQKARRELIDATSRFLERCRREDLISKVQLAEAAKSLGVQ